MGAQMRSRSYTWSLVLAGGEGSRLRSLTTDGAGASVPKQFCSLFGATTLLEDALNRGRAVADGRICAIVADHHHRQMEHHAAKNRCGRCDPIVMSHR